VLVTSIELRDFRTYARAQAQLGAGLTVVYGPNGVGKTNLLEALYFGCTGRPIRAGNERELVRFGADAARVVVHTNDGHSAHRLSVGYGVLPDEPRPVKRMLFDGAAVEHLADAEVRPLVSVFLPDRLELIKGSPSLRRAHLDQVIAAFWPVRRAARSAYANALLQRNALLAGIKAGRYSQSTLPSWDDELARCAVEVIEHRAEAIALLADPFRRHAADLGLVGEGTLEYRPRSAAKDPDQFKAELAERLSSDLSRGFSMHGPHRDELAIRRDGRDLRIYGSQGEQRLALLALLLAEREMLTQHSDRVPLMLLDDVMSELDGARRELLAGVLGESGQSVITTTDPDHVPGSDAPSVHRLAVAPGILQATSEQASPRPGVLL
jgi:DNA replication and repair protein RecF